MTIFTQSAATLSINIGEETLLSINVTSKHDKARIELDQNLNAEELIADIHNLFPKLNEHTEKCIKLAKKLRNQILKGIEGAMSAIVVNYDSLYFDDDDFDVELDMINGDNDTLILPLLSPITTSIHGWPVSFDEEDTEHMALLEEFMNEVPVTQTKFLWEKEIC
jgi:hypothetical protein